MDPSVTDSARQWFHTAVETLGGNAAQADATFEQAWAIGEQSNRCFHNSQHFYDVAGNLRDRSPIKNAVRYLSALYHDTIYVTVDRKGGVESGLTPEAETVLAPLIELRDDKYYLREQTLTDADPMLQRILTLFTPEQDTAFSRQPLSNELLSTLYASAKLRKLGIADKYILGIAAHIQGTIPFGPADHFDKLEQRLHTANQTLPSDQHLTGAEIAALTESAVNMANTDVIGFREKFPVFVEKTRRLMAEQAGNPARLDDPETFMKACLGEIGFLEGYLLADERKKIYHSVHGKPSETRLARHHQRAEQNIRSLGVYMRANAVAAALATALHSQDINSAPQNDGPLSLEQLLKRHYTPKRLPGRELDPAAAFAMKEAKRHAFPTDETAAYLLHSLGPEAIHALAELVKNTGIVAEAEAADSFLAQAQDIARQHGADFETVCEELTGVLQSSPMPSQVKLLRTRSPATSYRRIAG